MSSKLRSFHRAGFPVVSKLSEWVKSRNLQVCTLPSTLRDYQKKDLRNDFRSAINVALLSFPQGMAYAMIAGLPVHYGIYGSAVATLIATLFTRSRHLVVGPTNATAIMLLSVFASLGITGEEKLILLPILLVLVGAFLVVGAFLHVANLVQYISRSVITGYITAAAALIIASQFRTVLGFQFEEDQQATTFISILKHTWLHLDATNWVAVVVALLTLGIYFLVRKFAYNMPAVALTLVLVSGLGYVVNFWVDVDIAYLEAVSIGSFKVTVPAVDGEWIALLGNGALAIALLCMIEASAIGKSLAARMGDRFDANQEMLGLGMANIGCGLLSGMPASGSLTRSVLAWSSGASTAVSALISGLIVVAGAVVVGPLIGYIPRSSLAVLVILIGVSLINMKQIRVVTKSTYSDATVFATTCAAGLVLSLDTAIYLGVGTSIVLFLRKAAAPEMVEYTFTDDGQLAELEDPAARRNPEISIVHVEGNLFFGAAELFRDQIRRVCEDPMLKVVVLKMRNAHHLDATSVMALEELIRYMTEHNRTLLISEARKDVIRIFKRSGLLDVINRKNIFPDITQNPTLSTARALKRAKEILGDETADVKIYLRGDAKQ